MQKEHPPVILSRDCESIAIPSGVKFTMEKGTEVTVAQSLGGSYTVMSRYGLSRIDTANRDAIGFEEASKLAPVFSDEPLTEEKIWEALKTVYDPEIPVNIVDLGLIYHLSIEPMEGGGNRVHVKMTLTAPGCGMGPVIQADAKHRILALPNVTEAEVELVWDPPWHQELISEVGKMKLGMI
ncbi:MAG: putative Fe-S cluster assembly protein SufT [Verrucomicrobiota bacterium]